MIDYPFDLVLHTVLEEADTMFLIGMELLLLVMDRAFYHSRKKETIGRI